MTQHKLIYKDFPSHSPLRVFNKKNPKKRFGTKCNDSAK